MSKAKLKVLQFSIAASMGGRTRYILENWKFIDHEKFQFDFVTFSKSLDFEDQLLQQGCIVYHMSCYPRDNREKFIEEIESILKNGYDILHLHTSYWEDFVIEECARRLGVRKVIIHSHNTGLPKALSEREYESGMKWHYQMRNMLTEDMATDYWSCSGAAAEWLFGDRIPSKKIKVMNNAIDTEKYTFDQGKRTEIRNLLHMDANTIALCVVGRLVYQKNQEFMIKVMRRLNNSYKNYELYLVGDGERRKYCEALVSEYDLKDRVHFLGKRADVSDLLQAFDIYCMSSRYEGFPIALIEAQCSGVPCIVSEAISPEAKLTPFVTSLRLDEDLWVSKIQEVIREFANRNSNGSTLVKEAGYDIRRQVKVLEEMYEAE